MRSTFVVATLVLFAAGVTAQDKEKKYESKAGKYKVAFPGTPMTSTAKAGEVEMNIAAVEKGGGGFLIIYSDLPAENLKLVKPKDILAGGEKGLVDNFKAVVSSSKDIEFGKQKLPGRQIMATKDSINLRITIILSENRLYQVFVVGSKDLVTSKEADGFFESFDLTK